MIKSSLLALAMTAALSVSTTAHADVLTFNGTAGTPMPGADWVANGLYTFFDHESNYQGYNFSVPVYAGQWYSGYWNSVIFCGGSNVDCAYNGTDHLLVSPVLTVKRTDGAAFALNAVDLDNYRDHDAASAQTSFLVIGNKTGGGIVSTTVTLDDIPNRVNFGTSAEFNHFNFNGFTNLSSFEIAIVGTNEWNGLVLDNLDVTAAAPVPEPSSWAMLGLGLAGLAAYTKRRKA